MPVREIKTTLSLDGEAEFKRELQAASRQMRVMNADLRAMSSEFESTNDAQRYFAERSETLNNRVKQQAEIVRALTKAVEDARDKYGDTARQTDDYRISLSAAAAKLYDMRREAERTDRELAELGGDSAKIGRQIENGIGDAAVDASEKLEGLYGKIQADVNAMKSGVAWQTTMSVGEFVLDGINSVVDFVNENQEYNRKLAMTKHAVSMYGYNTDEVLSIARYAEAIVGDYDTVQEAIINLASAGFENEEGIKSAVQALLGVWLSSGGTLDFSSLAEDYLETVKTKSPTGTFAEAVSKFTSRTEDDVKAAMEGLTTTAEAIEVATAVLTEAGMQTSAEQYVKSNRKLIDAKNAEIELAAEWAGLAARLQPVTTDLVGGAAVVVGGLNSAIDEMAKLKSNAESQIKQKKTGLELIQNVDWTAETEPVSGVDKFVDKLVEGRKGLNEKLMVPVDAIEEWLKNLIPSAGAEELLPKVQQAGTGLRVQAEDTTAIDEAFASIITQMTSHNEEAKAAGLGLMTELNSGIGEGEAISISAVDAAFATMINQMTTHDEAAKTAGVNLMTSFGNGIGEGAAIPIGNVRDMVNSINQMLSQIAVPAYGLGWRGMTGGNLRLYMDGYEVGRISAGGVNDALGGEITTKMMVN